MKALIFVYSTTSFRIGGSSPLKQLQLGKNAKFADVSSLPRTPGSDVQLGGGVYLIYTDGDDVRPDVEATTGTRGTQYDILELAGKDKWPEPPSAVGSVPRLTADEYQQLLERIRQRMEQSFEADLSKFTETLGK
jgi:hypothetical protein